MKILIVKTSALGDVIHALPALTDAKRANPGFEFHWLVEENFAEIPIMNPAISRVITLPFRRLRRNFFSMWFHPDFKKCLRELRAEKYDYVIDAQGLLKSALFSRFARSTQIIGLDYHSARDPRASFLYQKKINIAKHTQMHAVLRMRELFAKAFSYTFSPHEVDYGLAQPETKADRYVMFLHGTAWATKLWPLNYWKVLRDRLIENGIKIKLTYGNPEEYQRAHAIAEGISSVEIIPTSTLTVMAGILKNATAVVAVDTGLAHLAAALNVPTISMYGPTNAALTGTVGHHQIHLSADFPCSPCLSRVCTYQGKSEEKPACFTTVSPGRVLDALKEFL